MIRTICLSVVALAMSLTASAAYLYWQIDQADVAGTGATHARVKYVDGDGVYQYFNCEGSAGAIGTGVFSMYLDEKSTGLDGYSFVIELLAYDDNSLKEIDDSRVGKVQSYSDLAKANAIVKDAGLLGGLGGPSVSVWHGGYDYKAIPEPAGATLLMLGVAIFGLKRKITGGK